MIIMEEQMAESSHELNPDLFARKKSRQMPYHNDPDKKESPKKSPSPSLNKGLVELKRGLFPAHMYLSIYLAGMGEE